MSSVRKLNTQYETNERTVALTQNKWTLLCGIDAGRWSIMFSIPAGQTTTPISTVQIGTADGIQLTAQTPTFGITAQDMPGGVAGNWYAFTASVAAKVQVFTTRDISVPIPDGG
jgi:hypothetical protein